MIDVARQAWIVPVPAATGAAAPSSALRVLVLDEGFMSGAHTATGLQAAGCDVTVLAATGGCGACRREGIRWSLAPRIGSEAYLPTVDTAIRMNQIEVVYAATEPIQWCIEDAQPPWASKVSPRPDPRARGIRRDKFLASALVASHGVRIPEQRLVTPAASDDELGALGMPVVVKGARGRGGNATRIAATIAAARRAVATLAMRGMPVFLQRHVTGPTCLVGGVFDDGLPLRWYCGIKRVQYPARTGPAAVIESIADAELDAVARRVFAALRPNGLASADFIRDTNGHYCFLELNPRPWGSLAAPAEAGVELFAALASLLGGGRPLPRLGYRVAVRSTVFPLYLLSMRCWLSERVPRALIRDLRGAQGYMWRDAGQAGHLARRLLQVWKNWG
jgi:hypothetical protein